MPILEQSWNREANTLGYESERAMLTEWYEAKGFSIAQISEILGYAQGSVRKRLVAFGITLRKPGGPNNLGKRKLRGVKDEELSTVKAEALAVQYDVHVGTVFKEKRLREKERYLKESTTAAKEITSVPATNAKLTEPPTEDGI